MENKIKKISTYSDEELQSYFNKENLRILHEMKIYTDDIYYNTGTSSGLDDWQYDMLKETLNRRDPEYVVPVGARIREHENRVTLPFWLGSMDKFKPEDARDIAQWIVNNQSPEYIIEDKLDGVSCLMIVKNGKIKLYTRGDGIIGADISYLAQYFKTIPKDLDIDINVRGELIMDENIFKEKYSNEYANPRNMVAGRIGAKTVRPGLRDIKFVAYEVVGDGVMESPSNQLDFLDSLGFHTVRRSIVKNFTVDSLMETLVRFKETSTFEIDGIIVQPNISYERNVSGNPEYAFAFKMRLTGNLVEAKVVGVDWNVSKWGQLKPRVEIDPVKLGGVTISWATGFNAKFIVEESIGPGAIIEVTRSGDVIPYIVKVIKKADEPEMPEIPYKWNETNVDIYTEDFGNEMCIKLIASFFAKLGIKHVGEKNVGKMYDSGYDTLLKIISASKEDFAKVPSFGERMAERTYDNIHNGLKNLSLPTVLGASGVFGFGLGRKKITTLMDDFPNILDVYRNMTKKELLDRILQIEGFSDKSAQKIVDNVEWADKFITAMKIFATFKEQIIVGDTLKGLKIVFTGFRDKKLEEEVVARGGKVTTTVSRNTSILVVINKDGKPSGKVQKAMDLNIKVLDKEEFINQYIK
jgi:NAD-dependent DNA ligase